MNRHSSYARGAKDVKRPGKGCANTAFPERADSLLFCAASQENRAQYQCCNSKHDRGLGKTRGQRKLGCQKRYRTEGADEYASGFATGNGIPLFH
jgi:hypothetical protein